MTGGDYEASLALQRDNIRKYCGYYIAGKVLSFGTGVKGLLKDGSEQIRKLDRFLQNNELTLKTLWKNRELIKEGVDAILGFAELRENAEKTALMLRDYSLSGCNN